MVGIGIFSAVISFACYNMIKFYRHRSYILGLFYLMAIMNMLLRIAYFISGFFVETSYWNVIFLCWPASMSCSLGLCQVLNYIVLYIRLDSYVQHRARKGSEISDLELETVTKKEIIVNVIFTVLIVAYPAGIAIFLVIFYQSY